MDYYNWSDGSAFCSSSSMMNELLYVGSLFASEGVYFLFLSLSTLSRVLMVANHFPSKLSTPLFVIFT